MTEPVSKTTTKLAALIAASGHTSEDAALIIERLAECGFAIVPLNPTEAMMEAVDCGGEKRTWLSGQAWIAGWRAMVRAA